MNNKEKNARLVTFKEEYRSKAGTLIYKKGTTHAIHHSVVANLQEKGAKMDVKKLDVDAGVRRLKQKRAENLKKAEAMA